MPKWKTGENIKWPDGKKVAVMLTFDYLAEALQKDRFDHEIIFADQSRGEYGPNEGIHRCLDVLDRTGVKGTFFVPGYVMEKYGDSVKEIDAKGHEIAYSGYEYKSGTDIPYEEELENMEKSEALFKKLTGKTFSGHRAPGRIMQTYTVDMIYERGYIYSSSMNNCDWAYCYERDGEKIPVVEFPTDCILNDYTYFFYTLDTPKNRSLYNNAYVREIWQDEFDGLAEEGNKIMVLELHPQLIGRASRAKLLENLIEYMQENGAWIATCEDVATYVLEKNKMARR